MISLRITGQEKALNTLQALSGDLQKKGVRAALRVAAKPIQTTMQGIAPDDSQTPGSRLRSGINTTIAKAGRKVRTGVGDRVVTPYESETALLVGPNKGGKKAVGYIGWFLERGAKAHDVGVIRNRKLAAKLKAAGVAHNNKRFGLAPILKINGRFATGPIPHPGVSAKKWMEKSLSAAQGQVEAGFYTGLEKWIAKYGR